MPDEGVNLSALWLPVEIDTSKVGSEMDKAGEDAKTHFGEKVKDIGHNLSEDLSKAGHKASEIFSGVGHTLKDALSKAGHDGGQSLTDSISKAGSDSARSLVSQFAGSEGPIGAVAEKIGGLIGGKIGDAIHNLDGPLKDIGIDIGEWQGPLQDAASKMSEIKGLADSLSSVFKGMPPLISGVAAAIGEIGGALAAVKPAEDWLKTLPGGTGKYFQENLPSGQDWNWLTSPFKHVWQGIQHPTSLAHPGMDLDANGNPITPPAPSGGGSDFYHSTYGTAAAPHAAPVGGVGDWQKFIDRGQQLGVIPGGGGGAPAPSSHAAAPPSLTSTDTAPSSLVSTDVSVSSPADLHAAGGNAANLYRLAYSLQGTPYSQALRNDCSGMVSKLAAAAVGLPPQAYFATPSEGSWLASHGFKPGMGGPGDLRIGWNPAPGNEGHTAATLPGGEHAESGGSHGDFRVGGKGVAGADDPFFTQHAYLPMGGMGGRGGSGGPSDMVGSMPIGTEHDPIYVTTPAGAGGSGGGSPFENQGQQLGQGLLSGLMQGVGLDGTLGKSPLDWGATKIGMGVLNWGLGMANSHMGGGMPMGVPGAGASISAAATPAGGSLGLAAGLGGGAAGGGGPQNVNIDNSVNLSGNGFSKEDVLRLQHESNARSPRADGYLSSLPAPPRS